MATTKTTKWREGSVVWWIEDLHKIRTPEDSTVPFEPKPRKGEVRGYVPASVRGGNDTLFIRELMPGPIRDNPTNQLFGVSEARVFVNEDVARSRVIEVLDSRLVNSKADAEHHRNVAARSDAFAAHPQTILEQVRPTNVVVVNGGAQ